MWNKRHYTDDGEDIVKDMAVQMTEEQFKCLIEAVMSGVGGGGGAVTAAVMGQLP